MKTIFNLLKKVQETPELSDLLKLEDFSDTNNSKKGFLYERLYEIFLVFFVIPCDEVYEGRTTDIKELDRNKYLDLQVQSGNSDGIVDIKYLKDGNIICISSKFYTEEKSIKNYDIPGMESACNDHLREDFKLGLLVKDKKSLFNKRINNPEYHTLVDKIKDNTYDFDDMKLWYNELYVLLNNKCKTKKDMKCYINSKKPELKLRLHQKILIEQLEDKFKKNKLVLLNGMCRIGKTFIMGGYFTKNMISRILWITPRKTDTYGSYKKMLDVYRDFQNYELVDLSTTDEKVFKTIGTDRMYKKESRKEIKTLYEGNVITIASRQMIDRGFIIDTSSYDLIIIDEAHLAVSDFSKDFIHENSLKNICLMTGTSSKLEAIYNIEESKIIRFGLVDIDLLSNTKTMNDYHKLVKKYTKGYSKELLEMTCSFYKNFPRLKFYYGDFDWEKKNLERDDGYHFTFTKMFSTVLKKTCKGTPKPEDYEFNNPNHVEKLMHKIFSLDDKVDSFIHTVKKENNLLGKRDIIVLYLPSAQGMKLVNTQHCLTKLLEDKEYFIDNYDLLSISSEQTKNSDKKDIGKYIQNKFYDSDKTLIILTNSMLEVGASIPEINIAIKLNDSQALDKNIQQNYRTITERENKQCGFVIDFNPYRIMKNIIASYKSSNKQLSYEEIDNMIIQENMIRILGKDFKSRKMDKKTYMDYKHKMIELDNALNKNNYCLDLEKLKNLSDNEMNILLKSCTIEDSTFEDIEVEDENKKLTEKLKSSYEKINKEKNTSEKRKEVVKREKENNSKLEEILKNKELLVKSFNRIINTITSIKNKEDLETSEEESKEEEPEEEVERSKRNEKLKTKTVSRASSAKFDSLTDVEKEEFKTMDDEGLELELEKFSFTQIKNIAKFLKIKGYTRFKKSAEKENLKKYILDNRK